MEWEDDYLFRRLACLVWPVSYDLATRKRRGSAAARRDLQLRYEGFRALRGLQVLSGKVDALLDEAGGRRG